MAKLKDPKVVPWKSLTTLIESEKLGPYGTFRGCTDGTWMAATPDTMEWQRTGALARGLMEHGVRSVVLGDLSEEWYLYSIAHEVENKTDVAINLRRYYPDDICSKMLEHYAKDIPDDIGGATLKRLFGDMLSEGQVYLPVRMLHRDLVNAGFPVVRYDIRWTPENTRPHGRY